MGITTKDLAQLCGVSRTTVHRALHGGGRIHPDTKEMILRVAKEHDYRPDLLARGLVKGRTYYIGVVVLDVRNQYFAGMLNAISKEAGKRGYCVNITLHDDEQQQERDQLMRLAAYHMDGIILSSVNEGEEYRDFLNSLGMPIISVDNKIADGIPFVSIDQKHAMEEATARVLEKGYERIVFVCPAMQTRGNQNVYVHRERLKGFEEARKAYPETEVRYLLDWTYLDHVEELVRDGKRTAFLCTADGFALDIMSLLREKGKKSPEDYGIVGFDNIDTLKYVSPKLATISNSVDAVAAAAMSLLFQRMEGQQDGAGPDRETMEEECRILPYEFIEGETI